MAGVEGVEPSLTEPESAVLPLDDTPVQRAHRALGALQTQVEILQKSPDVGKCESQIDRSRTTNGAGLPEAPVSPFWACLPSSKGESPHEHRSPSRSANQFDINPHWCKNTFLHAPLPQLDRGSDYESERRGFESLRARHPKDNAPTQGRFSFAGKKNRSGPVSRVLSCAVIYLDCPSPNSSSRQPGCTPGQRIAPLFALAPDGVCQAAALP